MIFYSTKMVDNGSRKAVVPKKHPFQLPIFAIWRLELRWTGGTIHWSVSTFRHGNPASVQAKPGIPPNWPMILVSWYGANAYALWEAWLSWEKAPKPEVKTRLVCKRLTLNKYFQLEVQTYSCAGQTHQPA